MIFAVLAEMDIDWEPFLYWFNIAVWVLALRIIVLPLLRGFISGFSSGQRTDRPARNGRASNNRLPAPFRLKDAYVIDGDTLARGDWRIRIYGMDAPEADQPGGDAATQKMRDIVAGKTLHILPKDVDIYGRLVARVRCGQIDVGAEMVRSGYAVSVPDFTQVYTKAEKQARRNRKGLWKTGRIDDPKAWRTDNN